MSLKRLRARTAVLAPFLASLLALTVGLVAPPARAEVLTFSATLDGTTGADATGSAATGSARIRVDTASRRVSIDMAVEGITLDRLWDPLVAAPIGPVHLHKYIAPGESMLVLPLPYSADYQATATGMRVTVSEFDYGTRAALLTPSLRFEDFVAAMQSGLVVLNIHTDAFNLGEISGLVSE